METAAQQSLFDKPSPAMPLEEVVLYGLGEFQSRGHKLADRELAFDRLRHAIDRACDKLHVQSRLSDEIVASLLEKAGARVIEIPNYFAKHPYRVTVPTTLASDALTVYHRINDKLS